MMSESLKTADFEAPVNLLEASILQDDTSKLEEYFNRIPEDLDAEQVHSLIMPIRKISDRLYVDEPLARILGRS